MVGDNAFSSGTGYNFLETLEPRLLFSVVSDSIDADFVSTSSDSPPASYSYDAAGGDATGAASTVLLSTVPEYFWNNGCGPTAAAMILGYWDILGYSNYFAGDASSQTPAVNAGIASSGHITDWVPTPDSTGPYHTDDCIADFFLTSRDPLEFGWSYLSYADDAFMGYSNYVGYDDTESWNESWYSLDWSDFTDEIDAGRPMMFLVDSAGDGDTDHFIPAIGYRTEPTFQYAAYTTWSNDPGVHWFDWHGMTYNDPWGIGAATYFIPPASIPDLTGTDASVSPPMLNWGESLTYSYEITNSGQTDAGGFMVSFYLSNDATISSTDHLLDSVYISGLDALSTLNDSISITLPSSQLPGFNVTSNTHIGMIIDTFDSVQESIETNNSNRGTGLDLAPVKIGELPDLIGTNFSIDTTMLSTGDVTASFSIQNTGELPAGEFYVRFYLSSNSVVTPGDTYLDQWHIQSLPGAGSYTHNITLSPGSEDPFGGTGVYTIGMIIDYNDMVIESSNDNNSNTGHGLDKDYCIYGTVPPIYPGGCDYWTTPDLGGDWSDVFSLDNSNDWDGWLFASDSADAAANFSVTGSDGLIPVLALYDVETGELVTCDLNDSLNSAASFTADIEAHKCYYLLSSGREGTNGQASIAMDLADPTSVTVDISENGLGNASGYLSTEQDINYFRFTIDPAAPQSALTITARNVDPSLLASILLWDETEGTLVTTQDSVTCGDDLILCLATAQAGHTYSLAITSLEYEGGDGSYDLAIRFGSQLPGDANMNGTVDLDDFIALKQNYGTGTQWSEGDFNHDNDVNLDDFIILKQNYGTSVAMATLAAVDALEMTANTPTAIEIPTEDSTRPATPATPAAPSLTEGLTWIAPLAKLTSPVGVLDILAVL